MATNDIEFIKLDVEGRIAQIREKLLQQDPLLPTHLAAIHQSLIQYEELVHLLKDEDIKDLIAGQKKHVGVELTTEIIKGKTRAPKMAKVSADDF
jgi:hypothetical protein